MTEEHILPLAHVAKIIVVEKYHLYRRLLLHDGAKFLYAHLETAIAHEQADCAVWSSEGCTHSSWQTKAHGAQSTTRYYRALLVVFEIATREHLVLSNICHQYRIALGNFSHYIHHFAHKQRTLCRMYCRLYHLLVFHLCIFCKRVAPFAMHILLQQSCDSRHRHLAIADNGYIAHDILVYLCSVDIEMDNLSLLSIGRRQTSYTVAKAHTDSYEHITLLSLHIGGVATMHTKHTHIQWMI